VDSLPRCASSLSFSDSAYTLTDLGSPRQQLFSAPLADYAFLIHLDPSVMPRHFQAISPDSSVLSSRHRSSVLSGSLMGEDDEIRIGWDPVHDLVEQLQVSGSLLRMSSILTVR
jgi:hypothetical protein